MIFRALLLALVWLLAGPAYAADDFLEAPAASAIEAVISRSPAYVETVSVREIRPSTDKAHKIPLTLIKLAGSAWTDKMLLAEIRVAEKAYGKCDASFGPITLIEARSLLALDELGKAPFQEQTLEWSKVAVPRDLALVKGLDLPRPIIFFRDRGGAYSFNKTAIAGSAQYGDLTNAVFITSWAVDNNLGDAQNTTHELGHVLLDEDHNGRKGNVLYCNTDQTLCEGTKVTKAQCAKVLAWAK